MNVGFINIYPSRPHGFHAAFLENQCRLLGFSTYFLGCGGSFDVLDPIFGLIKECEEGRDVMALLKGPICHASFKCLN